MPLSGASPARGAGALKGGCYTVGLVFTHTASTGAVSVSQGQTGFGVTASSAGTVSLTFPKSLRFLAGFASQSGSTQGGAEVVSVDLAAGTASLVFGGDPGTCTVYLTLVVGE